MLKKFIIASMLVTLFSLGCGSSGGGDAQAKSKKDIHDNLCLELGCSAGCDIYTDEDPDGAGTIQYCEDVENE